MEDEEYLQKYVAASLKAYPILTKFCNELNTAMKELKTDAEKEADRKEHERIRKFLDDDRKKQLAAEYDRGFRDGRKEILEGKRQFLDIILNNHARVTISIDRFASISKLRDLLIEAEREYGGSV